jgi:hypothetical protein
MTCPAIVMKVNTIMFPHWRSPRHAAELSPLNLRQRTQCRLPRLFASALRCPGLHLLIGRSFSVEALSTAVRPTLCCILTYGRTKSPSLLRKLSEYEYYDVNIVRVDLGDEHSLILGDIERGC